MLGQGGAAMTEQTSRAVLTPDQERLVRELVEIVRSYHSNLVENHADERETALVSELVPGLEDLVRSLDAQSLRDDWDPCLACGHERDLEAVEDGCADD
jgi:hypothetical protein